MVVGVSGYGYTGSGAVMDYFKERSDCDLIEVEFNLAYMPHGLQDLEYHLTKGISRYYSSDAAIKDFLHLIKKYNSPRSAYKRNMGKEFESISKQFVENISQLTWSGWWSYDGIRKDFWEETWRFRIVRKCIVAWERCHGLKCALPKGDKMYLSIMPENFQEEAKKYVKALISGFGCDANKLTVINQPFEPNAPMQSMRYFDGSKAIIVDRDPRDIYLFAKLVAKHAACFIPTDDVKEYVKYHKLCRMNTREEDSTRVLRIYFEDMVYDFENTIRRISDFVGVPYLESEKKYFNPELSINNTQLFLKYVEYQDDIAYIERELKEDLYPFEKYHGIYGSGEPFTCESD